MKLIKEGDIGQEYSVLLQEAVVRGGGTNPVVRRTDNNEPKQEAVFKFAFMFAPEIQFVSCNACKGEGATTTIAEKKCAIVSCHLVGSIIGGVNAADQTRDAS